MLFFHVSFGCFTIVHLNDNPCSHINVIIANNRDEVIFRPTDDAAYWPNDLSYIYGGRDAVRNYSSWLISNNMFARPFQKVLFGGKMFSDILEHYNSIFNDHIEETIDSQQINVLINDLMHEILQNRTFLYGNSRDRNLQEQFLTVDQVKLNE
ncbi:unnamed protein product, partial [Rotaria sp. Silwood2]